MGCKHERIEGMDGFTYCLRLVSCPCSVVTVEIHRERDSSAFDGSYVELLWLWAVTEIEKPGKVVGMNY